MQRVLAAFVATVLLGACVIVSEDDPCTQEDNTCTSPWFLDYCVAEQMYGSDCNVACTSNPEVYTDVCGGVPAVAGECDAPRGVCACWCEDSFDECVAGTERVHYVRDGTPYDVDCKEYCDGTCDEEARACACP